MNINVEKDKERLTSARPHLTIIHALFDHWIVTQHLTWIYLIKAFAFFGMKYFYRTEVDLLLQDQLPTTCA